MMSGAYAPCGTGVGCGSRESLVVLGATAGIDLGDGIQRFKNPAADRRAPPGGQTFNRGLQRFHVRGGRLDHLGITRKCHDADLRGGLLPLDERQGGGLGGLQAAG